MLNDFDLETTLWDKIRYTYWSIIPYNYRPKQLWYRVKCWLWKRYTTIKSRYLDHTYCDHTELIPHCMFECLSQFIEKECSPDCNIDWYHEYAHKIKVNNQDEEKFVRDEMQDLYNWWHQTYNKEYKEVCDILWKEIHKHSPTRYFHKIPDSDYYNYNLEFANVEDDEIYHINMKALTKLEKTMGADLNNKLHRLVNIVPYCWT